MHSTKTSSLFFMINFINRHYLGILGFFGFFYLLCNLHFCFILIIVHKWVSFFVLIPFFFWKYSFFFWKYKQSHSSRRSNRRRRLWLCWMFFSTQVCWWWMSQHGSRAVEIVDEIDLTARESVVCVIVHSSEQFAKKLVVKWLFWTKLLRKLCGCLANSIASAVHANNVWRRVVKAKEELEKVVQRKSWRARVFAWFVCQRQVLLT